MADDRRGQNPMDEEDRLNREEEMIGRGDDQDDFEDMEDDEEADVDEDER